MSIFVWHKYTKIYSRSTTRISFNTIGSNAWSINWFVYFPFKCDKIIIFDHLIFFLDRIGAGSTTDTTFSFEPQISDRETSPGFDELNTEIEAARLQSLALEEKRQVIKDKIAKKEKKKDKRKKRETNGTSSESEQNNCINFRNMSEVQSEQLNGGGADVTVIPSEMLPTERQLEIDARERQDEEERRRNHEPAIVFTNIDV